MPCWIVHELFLTWVGLDLDNEQVIGSTAAHDGETRDPCLKGEGRKRIVPLIIRPVGQLALFDLVTGEGMRVVK